MKFIQGKPRNHEANKNRLQQNPDLYRRRQAIVEHPFGVIGRQWDFYYIMTKRSIQHASADVGMIFTAYNLRRTLNILDKNLLNAYLKALGPLFRPLSSPLRPFLVLDSVAIWRREFSCPFVLGCCSANKMGNLDWELGLKRSC